MIGFVYLFSFFICAMFVSEILFLFKKKCRLQPGSNSGPSHHNHLVDTIRSNDYVNLKIQTPIHTIGFKKCIFLEFEGKLYILVKVPQIHSLKRQK